VKIRRGEIIGEGIQPGERPLHELAQRAKAVSRAAKVKFTALMVVVPDGASREGVEIAGSARGAVTAVVEQPRLRHVLREGLPDAPRIGGVDQFEVRSRLQQAIRFV